MLRNPIRVHYLYGLKDNRPGVRQANLPKTNASQAAREKSLTTIVLEDEVEDVDPVVSRSVVNGGPASTVAKLETLLVGREETLELT
ncbi:hypothetical protein MRX96_023548 [Rhipicephalus microplus]